MTVAVSMTADYAMIYSHLIALLDQLCSLFAKEHTHIILAELALCGLRQTFSIGLVIGALGLAMLFTGIVSSELLGRTMLLVRRSNDVPVAGIFIAGSSCLRLRATSVAAWVSTVTLAATSRLKH